MGGGNPAHSVSELRGPLLILHTLNQVAAPLSLINSLARSRHIGIGLTLKQAIQVYPARV